MGGIKKFGIAMMSVGAPTQHISRHKEVQSAVGAILGP